MNEQTAIDIPELESLAVQSEYMQELMTRVEELPESPTKALTQDCIEEILTYHNNGLQRILHLLKEDGSPVSSGLFDRLVEDPFIGGLLLVHDLHPRPDTCLLSIVRVSDR